MCTVKLRHKNKSAKCRFLVLPGDGPALLGMSGIELLNVLRIKCNVIGELPENRKFDSQTIEASTSQVSEQMGPNSMRQIKWVCLMTE